MTTLPEPPVKSPSAVAEKPAPPKFDAFHPSMPQVPGVNEASTSPRRARNRRLMQIGGIVAAGLVIGLAVLWRMNSTPEAAKGSPIPEDATVDPIVPALPSPVPAVRQATSAAATVEELSKPWASKKFTFVNPVTNASVDAIVIKLPSGAMWAFSLQEPYGQCQLEFVTDLARLASQFGFRASHPMVVSSCSNTIYDPLKVGALGGNVWARGEIVQGTGMRPPIQIETRVSAHSVIADNIE
jgi:hypothetical protein